MKEDILAALEHLSQSDKVMSTLIKNYGICNLQPHKKYFNQLLKAIVGQQLSVTAARSINSRLFGYYANNPDPQKISSTTDSKLRELGLSNAKVKYVKDLSQKILDRKIHLNKIAQKDNDEIIIELTSVKGIGVWTAHMFLMFTLGRLNILPYGDLGIRKAVMLNYGLRKLPDEKKISKIAKMNNWHPYCTIASLYLWKSLDNKPFDD